jgi:hypothetical protein
MRIFSTSVAQVKPPINPTNKYIAAVKEYPKNKSL